MGEFFFIETQEDVLSLGFKKGTEEIRLHSGYRPKSEAKKFIEKRKDEIRRANRIMVYGLGLGYHLKEIENYRSPNSKVYVVEMNPKILPYTEKVFSLEKFTKKGYEFCVSSQLLKVKSFLIKVLDNFEFEKDLVLIHRPSLRTVPENCTPIRYLLEEWEINRDSCQFRSKLLEENFLKNVKNIDNYLFIDQLKNKFFKIPIIIVSAGPSLSKNMHLLKNAKDKALVIAVGSVVKPLINANIFPDCIVISDPVPAVIRQVKGLNLSMPLFFLPTIHPEIVNNYIGPKVMLLQKGVTLTENFAQENQLHLIETGGSVATTALEIALYFGGNPIIFIGQDLAYTNGKTHVPGTTHNPWIPKINTRMRMVKGIDGDLIPTCNNLSIYKRWIERKISENPDRIYINATEGGADIMGTVIQSFTIILRNLKKKYPVEHILDNILRKSGG